jgi:subtilisin family serine protease
MPTGETGEPTVPQELVHVLIKYTGDTADLEAAGFQAWSVRRHPTDGFAIAAGPIPRDRLGELEAIEHIVMVEGSRPPRAELNRSVSEIKADQLHSGSPPRRGAGVVIGIIDSGIDIFHHSFRKPDGTTRILGIWDQALPRLPTEHSPAQFPNVGVEYDEQNINDTLKHRDNPNTGAHVVRTLDTDGHGTHVAGIAAGDGSQSGHCRGSGTFVGVAPLADLLIVKVNSAAVEIGESVNLVNALDWIWDHPAAANKGVVVNISQGDNRGPHDGNSLVEGAIEIDALVGHGRAVVKSAGNQGESACHAAASVPPPNGFLDVTFEVQPNDRSSRHLELWYGRDAALSVTVLGVDPPTGPRPTSPTAAYNSGLTIWPVNPAAPPNRQVRVIINNRIADPRNGDNCIEIDLHPAAPPPPQPRPPLPAGEWQLHLEALGPPAGTNAAVPFDCWIERGDNPPEFTSHTTRDGTITIPGTSRGVITVGAYSQSGFLFFNWTGDLADFSSYGPTRDGRPKPDISAPGVKITSARSQERGGCWCDCCYDFYTDETTEGGEFSGTSMAAPHVTGVVALMLEKDKTLPASDIKQQRMNTARVPDGVNPTDLPNNQWGAGKVDALEVVNGVVPPGPIAPPAAPVGTTPGVAAPPLDERRPGGDTASDRLVDLRLLARAALESPEGQHWAAVVSRHFSEVRGLINTNKKVAARWHRMDGPRLLRSVWQLASSGQTGTLQEDPRLSDWRVRTARFLDVLERFGSAELRRDVTANRDAILALGLPDLLAMLARSDHAA